MRDNTAFASVEQDRVADDRTVPWELFDHAAFGACVYDAAGQIAYVNGALCALLGMPAAELVGKDVSLLDDVVPAHGRTATGPRMHPDGAGARVPVVESDQPLGGLGGAGYRLRAYMAAPAADLGGEGGRAELPHLRAILEQSPIGVSVSRRRDGVIIFANSRFGALIGVPMESIVGSRASTYYLDDDQRIRVIERLKQSGSVINMEVQFRRADGSPFWTLFTVNDAVINGELVNLAWIYDYTERRKMEETLREMASRDPLTGIFNRRSFMELAQQQLARASRFVQPLSILVLDVDHFKNVNDTHGHGVGDDALRVVAAACTSALRTYDILGRLGGEEFVIALPDTTVEDALGVAERLRRQIARTEFQAPGESFGLTVSIGIACIDEAGEDVERAIHRADLALYRAKRLGRNRSAIYRQEW